MKIYLSISFLIFIMVYSQNEDIDLQITETLDISSIPRDNFPPPPSPYTVYPTNSSGRFRGQALVDGLPASEGDWIAALDSDGNTAGATEISLNNGIAYIDLIIYGDDGLNTPLLDEGMDSGEYFTLQLFDASENVYLDYPDDSSPEHFTAWVNANGAPIPAYNDHTQSYNFSPITLPVHLMQFDVSLDNNMSTTTLSWLTASEENSSHFIIEHSTDGRTFSEIGEVNAAENSITKTTYEFMHEHPQQKLNYYRLKAIDLDGTFEYSEIRTIYLPKVDLLEVNLFPMPAKDQLNISIDCCEDYEIDIQIYNTERKLVLVPKTIKNSEEVILDVSNYPSGNYILIYTIDGKSKSQEFIIVK